MMPGIHIWERTTRHAPFGLRLWDIVTKTQLVTGLEINVMERTHPQLRVRAIVNRSGVYCAFGLPGLCEFELGDVHDKAIWRAAMRRYRVEVRDPADRFLSFSFDADLPVRGLFTWLAPWASPLQPFVLPIDNGSPPTPMVERLPLFSTPSRQIPGPLAVVRAQLRENGTNRPAAWCLLTVSIDAVVRGIGLADKEGRVLILFPYPERPPPVLTSSPPPTTNGISWDLALSAYYVPLPIGAAVPDIPDLSTVLDQLNTPPMLFPEMSHLQLEYGRSLTVRSQDSSFLFVNTV